MNKKAQNLQKSITNPLINSRNNQGTSRKKI